MYSPERQQELESKYIAKFGEDALFELQLDAYMAGEDPFPIMDHELAMSRTAQIVWRAQ